MICHDILGIHESASAADIDYAYEKRIDALGGQREYMNQEQYDRKAHELFAAKEACLSWCNKSFAAKTTEKVQKYSSDFFSHGRVNEICWGPCTCCDELGGRLCTCNSGNRSFLSACCGMETPWLAILCDFGIYAWFGIATIMSHNKSQKEKEAALIQERHQKMIEDTKRELVSLKTKLSDITGTLESFTYVCKEAEFNLKSIRRMSTLFASIGSQYNFNGLIQLAEKQWDVAKTNYKSVEAEKVKIEQKIASLTRKLD